MLTLRDRLQQGILRQFRSPISTETEPHANSDSPNQQRAAQIRQIMEQVSEEMGLGGITQQTSVIFSIIPTAEIENLLRYFAEVQRRLEHETQDVFEKPDV